MKKLYSCLIALCFYFSSLSQSAPTLSFTNFQTGLSAAVDIINAKDGSNRLFVVQQSGTVRVIDNTGALLATPFLNISGLITYAPGDERGLLSLVFHPQYATNGYFFVFYNNAAGNTELAQYHVSADANVADAASGKVLLTIIKPYTNHNGCKLNFGPDGNLYISTGDGGSGGDPQNYSQNLNSLLGKMLRINVNNFSTAPYYTIPATNPLVGMANTRGEIFQWGLRNPWRWNFDVSGNMWIADVGQGAWEEVNFVPAGSQNGRDFGWRCYEGGHPYDLSLCGATPLAGKTFPIFEYGHNNAGGYSITGGLVYRGAEFPALQGYYICADYVRPNGWLLKSDGAGGYSVTQQTNFPANISSFGEAENGTLYAVSLGGNIYKVNATGGVVSVRLISFDAAVRNGRDLVQWKASLDPSLDHFELERSTDGTRFDVLNSFTPNQLQDEYQFSAGSLSSDRYYRLKLVFTNGSVEYSAVRKLTAKQGEITVSYISRKSLQLNNSVLIRKAYLFNGVGQSVKAFDNLAAGSHVLSFDGLSAGIYVLQCLADDGRMENVKIVL